MLTPIVIVVAFCSLISAALFFLGDDGAGTLTLFIGAAVIGVILFSDISNSGVSEKNRWQFSCCFIKCIRSHF